jgi:signal transduction histidine kinase/ActR/RegA family two-component response regulator
VDFLTWIFETTGFPPRWKCGAGWEQTPWLGWLHILSDLGVWSAYLAIPLVLGYFLTHRKDLPFRKIFVLFGAFILACGTTHLMEAVIFWWPNYRLAGAIKLFTAGVSWATVIALYRVVPGVLAMRTPEELEREIVARQSAQGELQKANAQLEMRVQERTSDLTQVVEKLTAAEHRLKETDRRKDEFLATLSHELRNPLAPIRHALEVMKLADGNIELIEQSQTIMDRQLCQIVRLIDDLLDVNRITRNTLELRRDQVELAPIIQQSVEMCRSLVESANQELNISLPPEPIYLNADTARLTQVFGNLLSNACKYTESGGRIWLTVEQQDSQAVVTVRDTGVGIPPEMLSKVFEMFTQVNGTLERSQCGLGIGLTLAKRLVEMHDGTVTAHSQGVGHGSEFVVRVPIVKGQPTNRKSPEPTLEKNPAARRRILVVDDNRATIYMHSTLLTLSGNEIETAQDGVEALEKAEKFQPDVILLDIGLPKMNGYDACRAIRRQPWGRNILIIALSGYGQDEDLRRSQEAGFDHHLVKPADHATLQKLIEQGPQLRPAS